MQPAKPKRPQLRTLTCPNCAERGLLRPILWGMPEQNFDFNKFASGGCVLPSARPPDCRCGGCFHDFYRDEISGFSDGYNLQTF
jgi:hypothetical protein